MRLVLAGLVLSACVATWAVEGDQTRRVASHLALYAVAFAAYVAALGASRGLTPRRLGLALGVAVVLRAALVAAPPLLSDDVYRYVWEGRVQLHGGNPYAWSDRPASEGWAALRDATWARVNHKEVPAAYPPAWELASRAVVAVSDSVTAMKAFVVFCELLAWGALAAALRRRGLPPSRLLVLAWSPLALVEIAGSGHNEPLGLLFLAVSLAALEAGRPLASALAAALGFQAKLLPGLVASAWARRYRGWHALAALALAALPVLPFAGAGSDLWRGFARYREAWRFNETLFAPLAAAFGPAAAQAVAAVAVLALVLALARRRAEPAAAGLAVVAAVLLLAADVLPWYALWLLPLLVLRDEPAALLFTGSVGLAYLVYPGWLAGGPWQVGWGVRALEYGPCVALALWVRRPGSG